MDGQRAVLSGQEPVSMDVTVIPRVLLCIQLLTGA